MSFPALFVVMAALSFALGLASVRLDWERQVRLQYQLDTCVGKKALEFKELMNDLDTANSRIRFYRRSLMVATVVPKARVALQTALKAEVLRQEWLRGEWKLGIFLWIAGRCGGAALLKGAIALPWVRDPPDGIGSKPLRWVGEDREQAEFVFSAWTRSRKGNSSVFLQKKWRARFGKR